MLVDAQVSAIKEAADDIGRYRADKQANSRIFTVFRRGRETQVFAVASKGIDMFFKLSFTHVPTLFFCVFCAC